VKIQTIEYVYRKLPLEHAFATAVGGVSNATCLFVRLTTECGLVGYGCGCPTSLTGESAETAAFFSERFAREIAGKSPLRTEMLTSLYGGITYGNPAVKAAFDCACWDIVGKHAGLPLYELMGFDKPKITTSITVGLGPEERMVGEAAFWVKKKFQSLKIKLGADPAANASVVSAIRDKVGKDVTLRVDANGAMTVSDALAFAHEVANLDLEFIEQPVTGAAEMAAVAKESPVRIAADETITDLSSFAPVLAAGAMHVATLKLTKVGGITTGRKMADVAQAYAVPCMVGCMSETQVSIAASVHLALAHANIVYADLDTFMFLHSDPSSGLKMKKGTLQPSGEPGLGISVSDTVFAHAKSVSFKRPPSPGR